MISNDRNNYFFSKIKKKYASKLILCLYCAYIIVTGNVIFSKVFKLKYSYTSKSSKFSTKSYEYYYYSFDIYFPTLVLSKTSNSKLNLRIA